MNHLQWKQLLQLKTDKDRTNKEADRGSTMVLMYAEYYKCLALTILGKG